MHCDSKRQPAALLVGEDRRLLEIRRALLARLFPMVYLSDMRELQAAATHDVNVVVLCHTLSAEQKQAAKSFASHRWVSAHVVQIIPGARPDFLQTIPIVSNDPASLLESLERLLPRLT